MNTTAQRTAGGLETVYLDAWAALPLVTFEDTAADEPLDPSEWQEACHPAYASTVVAANNR